MKAKLHIELFRACCHPQRVLSPVPAPGSNLRVAGRCCLCWKCLRARWVLWAHLGCLSGGCDQSGAVGRGLGKVFSSALPPWHLPGWNRGCCPKAVLVSCWGRGLRSNFCVCLLRSVTVPQTICELLFGNICFRTVIELTSGKYFVWTQTWESLVFIFDLDYRSHYWAGMASPTFVSFAFCGIAEFVRGQSHC